MVQYERYMIQMATNLDPKMDLDLKLWQLHWHP